MEIIIRDRPLNVDATDLGLDTAQTRRVIQMMQGLLEESFGEKRQSYPEREARHRARILWRWFCIMYGELGYTIRRCQETLPTALACELAGMKYSPPEDLQRGYRVRKRGEIPWTQL